MTDTPETETETETETYEYTPMTDEEVREAALGILAGTVFTDRQLRSGNDVTMVFPIIAMMSQEQYETHVLDVVLPEREATENPGMIYEFMEKAGPRSVNGYPMFYSLRVMSPPDLERVQGVMDELGAVLGMKPSEDAAEEE